MNLITFVGGHCPNDEICDCTSNYINCTCLHHEAISFKETQETFSGIELVVNGCGEVSLSKLSLKYLQVESVDLSELHELTSEAYTFYEAKITNFHVSNVKKLILEPQVFVDVKSITNLIIDNATLDELRPTSIAGQTIKNLVIKNSHIDTMQWSSLHVENCESISVDSNIIGTIKKDAIKTKKVGLFSFINNSVGLTDTFSFSISSTKTLNFGYCHFQKMSAKTMFPNHVDLLTFHNNTVDNCEEKAFFHKGSVKQFNFVDNHILVAKLNSFIPNMYYQYSKEFVIEHNELGCDCSIKWLIENPNFEIIKQRNFCHHPEYLKGLIISQLTVSSDKDGKCIVVGASTTTEVQYTTTQREDANDQAVASTKEDKQFKWQTTKGQYAPCEVNCSSNAALTTSKISTMTKVEDIPVSISSRMTKIEGASVTHHSMTTSREIKISQTISSTTTPTKAMHNSCEQKPSDNSGNIYLGNGIIFFCLCIIFICNFTIIF